MKMDLQRGTGFEGRGASGPSEPSERYYMNKAFGRSLERAKALDGDKGKPQEQPSTLQQATIEPDSHGGHRVTIERLLQITGSGREARRTEHWFPEVESAIQFLHRVLSGDGPEDGPAGERDHGQTGNNRYLPKENETAGTGHKAIFNELMDAARDQD